MDRYLIYLLLGFIFSFGTDAKTTSLGLAPDWKELDKFQESLTREEFQIALDKVYCPRLEWRESWIKLEKDHAKVRQVAGKEDWYILHFRKTGTEQPSPAVSLSSVTLKDMVIALDPGHIGGSWAKMERRHFSLGQDEAVKEGDLTLAVAKRVSEELRKLGACPVLVRSEAQPVTSKRPFDFLENAETWANQFNGKDSNQTSRHINLVKERAELLFYRVEEIHARSRLINEKIKPDLVICLHLNAAPWPDAENLSLVERNDYHVLVNGCYMGGELAYDDQRFEMLLRLLKGWHQQEQKLAEAMAGALEQFTGLPAFSYKGPNALKIGQVPGVWSRNLLANRKYHAPVVFLEPYVANSKIAYARLQKYLDKESRQADCLIEEYTNAVVAGVKDYCR